MTGCLYFFHGWLVVGMCFISSGMCSKPYYSRAGYGRRYMDDLSCVCRVRYDK